MMTIKVSLIGTLQEMKLSKNGEWIIFKVGFSKIRKQPLTTVLYKLKQNDNFNEISLTWKKGENYKFNGVLARSKGTSDYQWLVTIEDLPININNNQQELIIEGYLQNLAKKVMTTKNNDYCYYLLKFDNNYNHNVALSQYTAGTRIDDFEFDINCKTFEDFLDNAMKQHKKISLSFNSFEIDTFLQYFYINFYKVKD